MKMYETESFGDKEYTVEHWYTHNLSEEQFPTDESCIEDLNKLRNNILIKDDCIFSHLKFPQDYPGRGEEHDYVADWEEPWKCCIVDDNGDLTKLSYY